MAAPRKNRHHTVARWNPILLIVQSGVVFILALIWRVFTTNFMGTASVSTPGDTLILYVLYLSALAGPSIAAFHLLDDRSKRRMPNIGYKIQLIGYRATQYSLLVYIVFLFGSMSGLQPTGLSIILPLIYLGCPFIYLGGLVAIVIGGIKK